jgi:Tol biopolymer transport system component
LLRPADLEHLLPGNDSLAAGSLRHFLLSPADADLLLIWVHAAGDYVVSYRRSSEETQLLVALEEGGEMHGISLSPDGRWLAVTQWQEQSGAFPGQNYLHDLTGQLEPVMIGNSSYFPGAASWSPDGRWLVTLNDHGVLTLYAPAEDYRYVQVLDQEDCGYATWAGGQ